MNLKRILPLLLIAAVSFAATNPKLELEVKSVVETYTRAFEKGDVEILKSAVTENFLKNAGGEETFRKMLPKVSNKYKGASARVLNVIEKKPHAFVQIEIVSPTGTPLDKAAWFSLAKKNSQWKIDQLQHDFDPNAGP